MLLGLGTGTTATYFIEGVGRLVRQGMSLTAVATSRATAARAQKLGITLRDHIDRPIDLAVDGADEIDPELNLIKGRGGALLREKLVVAAAERFVVVAETDKQVARLGETRRVPVEVVRFGWRSTLERLLAEVVPDADLRVADDGTPFITDEGHVIVDCAVPPEGDLEEFAVRLKAQTGVVEHGLFLAMAHVALLGAPDGTLLTLPS